MQLGWHQGVPRSVVKQIEEFNKVRGGDSQVDMPNRGWVEKRIKACVLMDPELGNMSVTEALRKEGLKMSRAS